MALVFTVAAAPAWGAAWLPPGWDFRRAVDVAWDDDKGGGDELAVVDFFTAGHLQPDGGDVRIALDDGRIIPSHVLDVGPGDQASVVFALTHGVRRYYVYFGNPAPAPPPKGMEDVGYKCGLLMESRVWTGGAAGSFDQIEKSWARSKDVIGRIMIDRPFLGLNPFDERQQVISRISGSLFAPADGIYEFAGAAQSRGALWIDGRPVLYIPGMTGDIRFNAKTELKRGRHEFVFLHVCMGGDPRFSIGWRTPDTNRVDVIPREAFGFMGRGTAGPLEQRGKSLVADFNVEYAGECFYENHYSYRYRFTAAAPKASAIKFDWDFGDGQTAQGAAVDHVYLADGTYLVKIDAVFGATSDQEASRLAARRDRQQITHPPTDDAPTQSAIVARYDVTKLPPQDQAWALLLHQRAGAVGPMLAALASVANQKSGVDWGLANQALRYAAQEAEARGRCADMVNVLDRVSSDSHLQPQAATIEASMLLWRLGDFARAVAVLEPYAKGAGNARLKRCYGQALVLDGKFDDGRKVLLELPAEGPFDRRAAISGAMARTIEYFITEGDGEAGDDAWEKWQTQYPAEFIDGYGVVLQTRLMELRKVPEAAARVAEAFAAAVPRSSYSPQLLYRASQIMAKADPAKSKALMDLLKQKYPEDPLSQGP